MRVDGLAGGRVKVNPEQRSEALRSLLLKNTAPAASRMLSPVLIVCLHHTPKPLPAARLQMSNRTCTGPPSGFVNAKTSSSPATPSFAMTRLDVVNGPLAFALEKSFPVMPVAPVATVPSSFGMTR